VAATDLNPIEQVFAKFKAMLRKAAIRSFDALLDRRRLTSRGFRPVNAPDTFDAPDIVRLNGIRSSRLLKRSS
jgi:hypothetical protein